MLELIAQRQGFRVDALEEYYVRYYLTNGDDILTVEFNIDDGQDPFAIGNKFVDPARNILRDAAIRKGWDISKIKEIKPLVEMTNVKCRIVSFSIEDENAKLKECISEIGGPKYFEEWLIGQKR